MRKLFLLFIVAAVTVPAVANAHWFARWWRRPPAMELPEELSFDPVDATRARLYSYVIKGRRVQSRQRYDLGEASTTAQLTSGELSLEPLTFSYTDESGENTMELTVTFDPSTVKANYFGASFRGTGSATIDEQETPFDVRYAGSINERDGTYKLKACVAGYGKTDNEDGTKTVMIFSCSLKGSTTPDDGTTDEEPPPGDTNG